MPRETIASLKEAHEQELARVRLERDIAQDQRDRTLAGYEALAKARDGAESRARSAEREKYEALGQRDLLRGFIYREIPVRLDDLPAPVSLALGVVTGV